MAIINPSGWRIAYKILFTTFLVSAVVWLVIDQYQSRQLRNLFMEKALVRLKQGAADDRRLFDQYSQEVFRSVKLIIGQKSFLDFVATVEPVNYKRKVLITHQAELPSWLPSASIMRTLFHSRYALLYDADGKLHSLYHHSSEHKGKENLPAELLEPGSILRKLSHNQAYMTTLSGTPYVVSSESVNSNHGYITLLLASPLDSDYLAKVVRAQSHHTILVLIDHRDTGVVASSNNDLIPAGVKVADVKADYIMVRKSFFDYGASDLDLGFASFFPIVDVKMLTGDILRKSNYQRATLVFFMTLTFMLIVLFFERRIVLISNKINDLSARLLNKVVVKRIKGDEVAILSKNIDMFAEEITRLNHKLQEASDHDELTGLYNRRKFNYFIEKEYARTNRTDSCFALLLIDIDFFKNYNDNYGHVEGDQCLSAVAASMRESLPRTVDIIARYGGEEFVVILPSTDLDGGIMVAENLRMNIARLNIPHEYSRVTPYVTVSQGVAVYNAKDNIDVRGLIKLADQRLYEAKQQGRNRVIAAFD